MNGRGEIMDISILLLLQEFRNGPGAGGSVVSCFAQMFYVSFCFPWCIVRMERSAVKAG